LAPITREGFVHFNRDMKSIFGSEATELGQQHDAHLTDAYLLCSSDPNLYERRIIYGF
jgi:hypothetical protein